MFLYRHVRAAPVQGHAVTLVGTDPESEVSLLRDYLKWPAHRTWFVDNDKNNRSVILAMNWIKKNWSEANAEMIDFRKLLPRLGAVGFANLDFMGAPLQETHQDCLEKLLPLLLPEAIVGFTWLRGRENFISKSSLRLYQLGKGYQGNERRWAGFLRAVELLSKGTLVCIDRWEYLSNHSPMSVAILKKVG